MQLQWILSILSIIVSMGLLVIIMGQYQVLSILEGEAEKLQVKSKRLDDQLTNEGLFKVTIEKLMAQAKKVVVDLEATVAKLGPEMEKKKTENDACQAEKKTRNDELAEMQKVHTDTEAALKSESIAWNQEIETLQAQLTGYRLICDHVKNSSLAMKLCGVTTTLTPPLTKM